VADYIVINGIRIDKNYQDFVSETFGRLTTIGPKFVLRSQTGKTQAYQVCQCECGSCSVYLVSNLRKSNSTQCNKCATIQRGNSKRIHGDSGKTKEYKAWKHIKERCYNKNDRRYSDWGGRGIKVCDRWLEPNGQGYINFLADIGRCPPECNSIDRKDNDGNYCPENCRWATTKQQSRNQRTNRTITAFGKTQCVAAWAEELGISAGMLYRRIYRGWSAEEILTAPPKRN